MRFITLALISLLTYSCIPLQIAPHIKDHKITKGKRFKRKLPKQQVFIFEDPKNANEFYNYINTKFQLADDVGAESNIPIVIDNRSYFLSFYEVEKSSKALDLAPALINGAIGSDSSSDGGVGIIRIGKWYIALTVNDLGLNDALDESHRERNKVIRYLSSLKNEYLHSSNYYDAYFKTSTNSN
jgi:hypothetical protein